MNTWIPYTARATSWWALAVVSGFLCSVSVLAVSLDSWPAGQLGVVAAAVAASLVAGLHDPAAALLAASPTSSARRRARRLLLLAPVALVVWLLYVGVGRLLDDSVGWSLGAVVALAATGVAVEAWFSLEAGVAVPIAWFVASWVGGSSDYAEILFAWEHHPWIVTTAAVAALTARSFR